MESLFEREEAEVPELYAWATAGPGYGRTMALSGAAVICALLACHGKIQRQTRIERQNLIQEVWCRWTIDM